MKLVKKTPAEKMRERRQRDKEAGITQFNMRLLTRLHPIVRAYAEKLMKKNKD